MAATYQLQRNNVPIPKEYLLKINNFGGINISVNSTQIADNESPEMLNLLSDDKGALDGRKGWTTLFTSLGTGSINCLLDYAKSTGHIYVFAYGTKLYKIDDIDTEPFTYTEIYDGVEDTTIRGFTFNNKLYLMDGTNYLVYNGTTVTDVVGHIPTTYIGSEPAGGGTKLEDYNYISAGSIQQFTGDGATTTYQLIITGLDATAVSIDVSGSTLVENTHFTVNRTLGTIDFSAGTSPYGAPADPTPGANNVSITAYKTITGNDDIIRNCTVFYIWGNADTGNNIFFSGNPNYDVSDTSIAWRNWDFRSATDDPTYFPLDGATKLGNANNAIKCYSELYDKLLVVKENQEVYTRTFNLNEGDPVWTHASLNGAVGASGSDSIAILDNYPTYLTKKGVFQSVSVDTTIETTVKSVSEKVNKNIDSNNIAIQGILELGSLSSYIGVDFDKKYWLFHPTLDYSWVYDYSESSATYGSWYRLDGFNMSCALEIGGSLYWGRADKGTICRFKTADDTAPDSDTDEGTDAAITKTWISKLFDFGSATNLKYIKSLFFTVKTYSLVETKVYTRTDTRLPWRLWKTIEAALFVWSTLTWSTFTWASSTFPKLVPIKVKQKNIGLYQIKVESTAVGAAMGIINMNIKHQFKREVR